MTRPALQSAGRLQLVGLCSPDPIPEGAMLVDSAPGEPQGHVTAGGVSILGDGAVALGLLRDGRERMGEALTAWSPTRRKRVGVTVTAPIFHDPQGARYRD